MRWRWIFSILFFMALFFTVFTMPIYSAPAIVGEVNILPMETGAICVTSMQINSEALVPRYLINEEFFPVALMTSAIAPVSLKVEVPTLLLRTLAIGANLYLSFGVEHTSEVDTSYYRSLL